MPERRTMAKKNQEQSPAEQENVKLHGDDAPKTESREVQAHELNAGVVGREVSDEDLKAMEEAASEPTIDAVEASDEPARSPDVSGVAPGAVASPDSADYVYRDVLGTSIVGYQEQVPKE